MIQRRGTEDPVRAGMYPNWAWSWPANRRVLYNRASCDVNGKPWDPSRRQVWWDEGKQSWVGNDVPDFKARLRAQRPHGPLHHESRRRGAIVRAAGRDGRWAVPRILRTRSRVRIANLLHPNQSDNPVVKKYKTDMDKYGTVDQGFNVICTTYRLTEHYHYWTKNNPMNVRTGAGTIRRGSPRTGRREWESRAARDVKVTSARSHYIAKAMVTRRIRPMQIDGKEMFQIGIPIHWGFRGIAEDEGKTAEDTSQ